MRIRRSLQAATVLSAAVVLGTALPAMSAANGGPENATAPYAAEDGTYPNRAAALAATGADLIAGDGNIVQTPCGGDHQIQVWALNLPAANDSKICFKAADTGYLKVSIPRAYRIRTFGRDIKASVSIANTTEQLNVPKDTSKGFGEADPSDPKQAVVLDLRVTGTGSTTPPGVSADVKGLGFNGKLLIGETRRCSAALVDAQWVISAKSCFADNPAENNTVAAGAPKEKTTVVLGKPHINLLGGHTSEIVQLVPHPDRDLVMARLDKPAANIAPVPVASAAPATGQQLTVAGFGRTTSEWAPGTRHEAAFTTGAVAASGFDLTAKTPADATVCAGDAGGPALRQDDINKYTLFGITSRSWQGDCLGVDETRSGAFATRVDDVAQWVLQTRALAPGWKTETLVQTSSSLYQGIRLADGSWTGFTDVQAKAGDIKGVRSAAAAGINADTHVVALGGDGIIHHTYRNAEGSWSTFGDVGSVAGVLGNVTQVSAVSIGNDLHVVAVADGKLFHTLRNSTGHWSRFGDISGAAGPIGTVTAAATASVGGELQVIAVSNGKAFHTVRNTAGQWSAWGNVAQAAGTTGPITAVSMAGTGGDAQIVIATDNGTRQYHAIRKADRTWDSFGDLKGYLGSVTVKSLGAASVDGALQLTATTADNKLLHVIRRADRTWSPTTPVDLQGVTGSIGSTALTGTL
ncbi:MULTISPECIES: trypsin-like serine protease [unclassified Streptomyces]|uniref:trypsin-like serine protease n=1 Tax=unclassified Streptomyces TaxID=2593676 RepID=UPI00131CFFD9|nr:MULTISPECIES: trypsin-like serine protease [unclassified Streptomyces]